MTPTEAVPGHIIGTTDDITGVVHTNHTQILIHTILTMTLHIEDHLHTGTHQPTQETATDHALDQPTTQLSQLCINLHHIPEDHKIKHIPKRIQE